MRVTYLQVEHEDEVSDDFIAQTVEDIPGVWHARVVDDTKEDA